MQKGLEFDPGFAPYILAFRGTVEYLYMDINRFKNLSQRKMKFRQYYKKFLELFDKIFSKSIPRKSLRYTQC